MVVGWKVRIQTVGEICKEALATCHLMAGALHIEWKVAEDLRGFMPRRHWDSRNLH